MTNREGVGVIEAPRGTLLHHYWVDENGQLERVNLIVATGHNNWAMSKAVDSVAKAYVDGKNITEGVLNRVEARDPGLRPVPLLLHPRRRPDADGGGRLRRQRQRSQPPRPGLSEQNDKDQTTETRRTRSC